MFILNSIISIIFILLCAVALLGISSAPAQVQHDFAKFEEEMGWMKVDACQMQSHCCSLCGPEGDLWIQCNFYMGTDMNWHCKCSFEGPC